MKKAKKATQRMTITRLRSEYKISRPRCRDGYCVGLEGVEKSLWDYFEPTQRKEQKPSDPA